MEHPGVDENYLSQWDSSLERSLEHLEPDDVLQIRAPSDANQVRDLLQGLAASGDSQPIKLAKSMILPSLDHFDGFNSFLITKFGSRRLQTSGTWGMFYLSVKLASETPDVLRQMSEMIKRLGQKVDLFNEYARATDAGLKQLTEAALDVHLELVNFFTSSIHFLRQQLDYTRVSQIDPAWMKVYSTSLVNIDATFQRIDRLTQLAKRRSVAVDLRRQQSLLSGPTSGSIEEEAKLPCIMLPPSSSSRFYDRDGITDRIDSFFHPDSGETPFLSLVLHGIGGVGKSHVALKYAHLMAKAQRVKAILWFHSETQPSLEQSFTEAAVALGLPQAGRDRHQENRILLLSWLQQTATPWLLIFDNVEDPEIMLPYWPSASTHGSILITSRNRNLQFNPADLGIEVPAFDAESGSKFLLHLLRMDVSADISSMEVDSAVELSQHLDGHALAINFMAGLIQRRHWTIQEFLDVYEKNKSGIHNPRRGPNALSTIWQLSFESLDAGSASVLGILSYINPDSVAQQIFTDAQISSLPACLEGCTNELELYDVLEPLLTLALIQRDKETKAFSTHRLVQTQYRYYLASIGGRQDAFDDAVKILFDGFGRVESQLYDRWAQCQLYIQQILSLKNNFKKEVGEPDAVHPTLQFCWLLSNSSRFLLETADYVELEDVLEVAESSFQRLTQAEKAQGNHVMADILDATGLLWAHRGFFIRALPHMRQCNKLRTEDPAKSWVAISWSEGDLGNVLASAGEYGEALEWVLKAEETRRNIEDDNDAIKSAAVLHKNIGNCHAFLNQFAEAEERLELARKEFEGSKNWAMLASTLFMEGNLLRRTKKHQEAKSAYLRAQEVWLAGGRLRTHHFNGACMYKLGCISDDLGETEQAIHYLREALVVAKLKETVMTGDYARVLFKLSKVLERHPGGEVEATEKAAEALRIRLGRSLSIQTNVSSEGGWSLLSNTTLGDGTATATSTQDASEEREYDDMVYILWR